jgi:Alg9-like mannosyltransferase family
MMMRVAGVGVDWGWGGDVKCFSARVWLQQRKPLENHWLTLTREMSSVNTTHTDRNKSRKTSLRHPSLITSVNAMNHPAALTPRKSFAPPLRLKRRTSPPPNETFPSKPLLAALLALRIFNALAISTFFQPDEYYQSLEVAWQLVFGYGERTWEWREGIRGVLYPSLFASVWGVLKAIGVTDANVLVSPLC